VILSGTVATGGLLTGTCPSLRFVLVEQGTGKAFTILTSASTQFVNGTCANVAATLQVQVKGVQQADGTVAATFLQSQDHTGGFAAR
jgi:hypothetical protein